MLSENSEKLNSAGGIQRRDRSQTNAFLPFQRRKLLVFFFYAWSHCMLPGESCWSWFGRVSQLGAVGICTGDPVDWTRVSPFSPRTHHWRGMISRISMPTYWGSRDRKSWGLCIFNFALGTLGCWRRVIVFLWQFWVRWMRELRCGAPQMTQPWGRCSAGSRAAAAPDSRRQRSRFAMDLFATTCFSADAVGVRWCVLPNVESEAVHIIAWKLHLCFGTSSLAVKPWPYGCTPTGALEASWE